MEERLQKFMARCGVASRRKCEEYIAIGRVIVNDNVITELGFKVDAEKDIVSFDSKIIKPEENKVYIALNKPTGYVSTVKDEKDRETILDLVKVKERIYPIGRLDYDSSGLIILTNDGDIYNNVIHPRQSIDKVYRAILEGVPTKEELFMFCSGVDIGDYKTAAANIDIIMNYYDSCEVEITIHEGKNRQIRRMCEVINHPVIALNRINVGEISLGDLDAGSFRYLTDTEIKYLKEL
jgi:23S rRNA pseudouridine2605 synthase